jgi:predicted DNA-binding protein (UPF0251 family)
MTHADAPKYTCDAPVGTDSDLEAVLARLSTDQIRFVIARSETTTDKDAARAIGISPETVKHWPKSAKADVASAVKLMAHDGVVTALHIRRRNLAKAMGVKVAGLDSPDEKVRQAVASEIIEWELGKAEQPNRNTDTGTVILRVVYGDGEDAGPDG